MLFISRWRLNFHFFLRALEGVLVHVVLKDLGTSS